MLRLMIKVGRFQWLTQNFSLKAVDRRFSSFLKSQGPILQNFDMESYETSENLGRGYGPLGSPLRTLPVASSQILSEPRNDCSRS